MNEYINTLSSDDSTIEEQLNAVTCLQQYKVDIETIFHTLKGDEMDKSINIDNVNTAMSDIKKKLDKIDFENLSDITKLHKIKSQIMTCNHLLNNNKPNIKVVDNGTTIDITNKIKDKFVIADFLNENQVNEVKDDNIISFINKRLNVSMTLERYNSDDRNKVIICKHKIFSCLINDKYDILKLIQQPDKPTFIDDEIFQHTKMIVPDFNFNISHEVKKLKNYTLLKYEQDIDYINICLNIDDELLYAFIHQNNNYFYIYFYENEFYILTNDFNFTIVVENCNKIINHEDLTINDIINQIYTTVTLFIVEL
jgi:hypothetical protein